MRTRPFVAAAALVALCASPSRAAHEPQTLGAQLAAARGQLFASLDGPRLQAAQARLVTIARDLPARAVLSDVLQRALSGAATARSGTDGIVADHRATLIAVAFYVNNWGLESLLPEARTWPKPERRLIVLRDREDYAQHFAVSAGVAAASTSPIAAALGVYKEMKDTQGASGFSFTDLAADRAGVRFGAAAVQSAASAAGLIGRLSGPLAEADMMPAIDDLPDHMPDAEFKRRFGAVDSPAYNALVAEIDRRIAALPIYK
jgi:hypothetical protein